MNNIKNLFTKDNIVKGLKWFFNSFIWLFILLFIIDIVTKIAALNHFGGWDLYNLYGKPEFQQAIAGKSFDIIPGFIGVGFTLNDGAAWGMFGNLNEVTRRVLLIGISVIMTGAFIGYYCWKFKKLNGWYKAILMCLAAGAFGNLIDRAFYPRGLVIDFLEFKFMNFPIFNFADSVLVVTIVILMIYIIYEEIKEHKEKKLKEANGSLNKDQKLDVSEADKKELKTEDKPQNLCSSQQFETKISNTKENKNEKLDDKKDEQDKD